MLAELGRLWDELERDDCRCIVAHRRGRARLLRRRRHQRRSVRRAGDGAHGQPRAAEDRRLHQADRRRGQRRLRRRRRRAAALHRHPRRGAARALRPARGEVVDLPVRRRHHQARAADRPRARHGPAADGAADRCRAGGDAGPGQPCAAAGAADGLGAGDGGDDRRQQPLGGAGGEAADQRHHRRPRADAARRWSRSWAMRCAPVRTSPRALPRSAKSASHGIDDDDPAAEPHPRRSSGRAGSGDAAGAGRGQRH